MFEKEVNKSKIKEADICVGIASLNEADNIAFVADQAGKGLKKYFPDMKPVIINCDNNSPDGTEDAFLNAKSDVPLVYITTPTGIKGKGYNFENMFRKSSELGAKINIVVDADLKSITPEWIKYFGESIKEGNDYTSPLYSRHKYDGTIRTDLGIRNAG